MYTSCKLMLGWEGGEMTASSATLLVTSTRGDIRKAAGKSKQKNNSGGEIYVI